MAATTAASLATGWSIPPLRGYAADRWSALGTYAQLVVADADRLAAARSACEQILARIDLACSRFRDDSDLSRANRGAGSWIRVDPLLVHAVTAAMQVAEDTSGLVDPTLGRHLVALGYDRDLAEIRRAEALRAETLRARPDPDGAEFLDGPPAALPPVDPDGWRRIDLDPDGAIRVPAGLAVDLGATGKAFAADLIAEAVPVQVGTELIISLGGDVAVGTTADGATTSGSAHRWRVAVAERPEQAEEGETVVLETGGLATSSTLARQWRRGAGTAHHLLDPRTGLPVEPVWRTASVCAGSCLEANAASTAAIVMGAAARAWLERADLAARLVAADGSVLRIAGWPEPGR